MSTNNNFRKFSLISSVVLLSSASVVSAASGVQQVSDIAVRVNQIAQRTEAMQEFAKQEEVWGTEAERWEVVNEALQKWMKQFDSFDKSKFEELQNSTETGKKVKEELGSLNESLKKSVKESKETAKVAEKAKKSASEGNEKARKETSKKIDASFDPSDPSLYQDALKQAKISKASLQGPYSKLKKNFENLQKIVDDADSRIEDVERIKTQFLDAKQEYESQLLNADLSNKQRSQLEAAVEVCGTWAKVMDTNISNIKKSTVKVREQRNEAKKLYYDVKKDMDKYDGLINRYEGIVNGN